MPLYEDKLISPLAIRFSSESICKTFQDGHDLEATIEEIKAGAGVSGYDVMLEAPFPYIKIIRWSADNDGSDGQDHWFTFDNRRLYCLQRVAAEYFPKNVAVKVKVVYAGAGTIRQNFDARTQGLSVSIDHAFPTSDEQEEWAWQDAVETRAPPGLDISVPPQELGVSVDDEDTPRRRRRRINGCGKFKQRERRREALSNWRSLLTRLADVVAANDAKAPSSTSNVPKQGAIDSAARPQGNALTSLIGQLLDLKVTEKVKPCVYTSQGSCSTNSSCDYEESSESELTYAAKLSETSLAAPPGIFYPEVDEVAATAGKGSLSGLIGQLLQTYKKERTDSNCESEEASTAAPMSPPPGLFSESGEASIAVPLSLPPGLFERSKVRHNDAEFRVEHTPPLPRIKHTREEAQAEYMAKMMQWQRVQWQAKQMAQFQALQNHQAMSLYAARAAHAAAYSRRSQ